jgi:hypothetical protein
VDYLSWGGRGDRQKYCCALRMHAFPLRMGIEGAAIDELVRRVREEGREQRVGGRVRCPPVLFCAPDMIRLLFYCLVLHTTYPSGVRISIAMLSVGAWSGLASIARVALLPRVSRITLITRLSGVAFVPGVTGLACVPLLSGLPLRAWLSGRSRLSLRCRRWCCLRWRCLATGA